MARASRVALLTVTGLVGASPPRSGGANIGFGLLGLLAIAVKVRDDRSAPRLARIEATVVLDLVVAAMLALYVGAPLLGFLS